MTTFRGALVVALIACALGGPALFATAAAEDNITTTLQGVVQRNNEQQVQAIATRNMSLVAETSTEEYARQVTGVLQTMLNNHVTGMTLLKLDWGPTTVSADGTTATVATLESWRIMSSDGISDGTIDYEPARNDYTLVFDKGSWRIKSVVQTPGPVATFAPTATPTVTPPPTVTPTATPLPTDTPVPTATPSSEDVGEITDPSMEVPLDMEPSEPGEPGDPGIPDEPVE
jgi:hypothetical protein